jgi:predicted ATPase
MPQVPETVHAILAARIDRLPPAEKSLLQSAAVVGTEVPLPLLRAVAETPEEDLRHGLAHLQSAEYLYETSLYPEVEYTFKHALTHEVAYASLLLERRRALHTRILAAMESSHADRLAEHAERLAHHAVRAEAWNQAVGHLCQAGLKAAGRSAYRQAAAAFEEALAALGHLPETRATLEAMVDLLVKRGNPFFIEESIRTLVETGALTRERGAYRLTRPIQAIEVPATAQVILTARIDRLPADDKELLQTASVIGKDVPSVLLHAPAETAEEAVQRGLSHLQESATRLTTVPPDLRTVLAQLGF